MLLSTELLACMLDNSDETKIRLLFLTVKSVW